ncbi:MAG TPA: histidine phosphatase family protein [Acidimicrobiia bacterium]|nr:histidine phosphatase family protein [Acidimicrobiia bacterium]
MAARVHLVRHGEVLNPEHLVYASLDGFGLSAAGAEQARAASRYLGRQPLVGVWSSPLERALRTAEPIALRAGLPVRVEPGLAEWRLMDRWAGISWEDIPQKFPGELEAFLDAPADLPFSPESLAELAERVAGAIRSIEAAHPHGDIVVVSHSASLRAAAVQLTGSRMDEFWAVKPGHGAVTTLRPGPVWETETVWSPETV